WTPTRPRCRLRPDSEGTARRPPHEGGGVAREQGGGTGGGSGGGARLSHRRGTPSRRGPGRRGIVQRRCTGRRTVRAPRRRKGPRSRYGESPCPPRKGESAHFGG